MFTHHVSVSILGGTILPGIASSSVTTTATAIPRARPGPSVRCPPPITRPSRPTVPVQSVSPFFQLPLPSTQTAFWFLSSSSPCTSTQTMVASSALGSTCSSGPDTGTGSFGLLGNVTGELNCPFTLPPP